MLQSKLAGKLRRRYIKMLLAREASNTNQVDAEIKKLEKSYGKGAAMTIASRGRAYNIRSIRTKWPEFDDLLTGSTNERGNTVAGTGFGMPLGRIIEVYGPEASGKTTLTLQLIAAVQRSGGLCAFIDAEHGLDTVYAQKLGVNMKTLLLSQPDHGEQAFDIAKDLAASGKFALIVVDSVAALVPEAEQKKKAKEHTVAMQARLMSSNLRKLVSVCSKSETSMIFINQIRMKIGVMFGNPETTTGGNALKFYASIRLDIRTVKTVKKNGKVSCKRARIRAVKNKVAPPFREIHADIYPNEGIRNVYGEPADDTDDDEDIEGEEDNAED